MYFGRSFKHLILAILDNGLQDLVPSKDQCFRTKAFIFAHSQDCKYMCEVIGVDYNKYKKVATERYWSNAKRKNNRNLKKSI